LDTRIKDKNWELNILPSGRVSIDDASLAVLMDIRDRLISIDAVVNCHNALEIPRLLRAINRAINRNTAKPKKKKK